MHGLTTLCDYVGIGNGNIRQSKAAYSIRPCVDAPTKNGTLDRRIAKRSINEEIL
jgi:hypothetical protein